MAKNRNYTVAFRRKRTEVTNYKKRLGLLKSRLPRMIIRRGVTSMLIQFIEYEAKGDKVVVTVSSNDLKKNGLSVINGNVPVAYLTGLLAARKAVAKGIKRCVVDFGLQRVKDKSRLYASVKGAIDGGLDIHTDEKVFPSEDRLMGKHIDAFAQSLKENKEAYEKQFSAYLKEKIDPTSYSQIIEKVKASVGKQ